MLNHAKKNEEQIQTETSPEKLCFFPMNDFGHVVIESKRQYLL